MCAIRQLDVDPITCVCVCVCDVSGTGKAVVAIQSLEQVKVNFAAVLLSFVAQ